MVCNRFCLYPFYPYYFELFLPHNQEKNVKSNFIIYFLVDEAALKMALSTKGMFDIKVWDDIAERCNNPDLMPVIDNRTQLFYPVNPEDAIVKLIEVGQLLQLSYAGSRTYGACSVHVIEVTSKYQDLVKSTVSVCTSLTNIVLHALSYHKPALIYAEKRKPNKAIGSLGKCALLSKQMADECEKLANEIGKLSRFAINAFTLLLENFEGSESEKEAVMTRASKFENYFDIVKEKEKDLQEKIDEARIMETVKDMDGNKNIKERLIYGLLGPISYIATDTKSSTNELKQLLQNESRKANDDLRESVEHLKDIDYSQSDLRASAAALEVVIKILENVKLMFLNANKFWKGVTNHASALKSSATADELRDEDVFDKCNTAFVNEIKTSGLGWLATGKICRKAALDIRKVSHGVNRTNTKLFDKIECEKLIQKMTNVLMTNIDEENEKIEDVKSDWLYEVLMKADPLPNLDAAAEETTEQQPFSYLENGNEGEVNGENQEKEAEE